MAKLAFEADLAARLNLSRASLRNYADAVALVRSLPDPALRAALFRSSAVAAAVASRWFRRDPPALIEYLRTGGAGAFNRIIDDRALAKAERDSRRAPGGSTRHRLEAPENIDSQFQWLVGGEASWRWGHEITRHVPELTARPEARRAHFKVPGDPLSQFLGVARVLTFSIGDGFGFEFDEEWSPSRKPSGLPAIGFIDISERVVLERYRAEARNIWTRAVALSLYVPLAVLVLPDSAARRHLLSEIPVAGIDWLNHPDQATKVESEDRRCRSRPILARLPHKATIMVATRRSLQNDLFR
ncbi:MAG TPA: hypothetical protein VIL30_12560 [Ramlibacter sp.]|jgi:hypothetical protein